MTGRLKSNKREWDRLKNRLMKFNSKGFDVGFFGNSKYPDQDYTAAEVAWMNDQGTSVVPPRPFMTVDFMKFASKSFQADAKTFFLKLILSRNFPYVKEVGKLAEQYKLELKIIIDDYPGSNSREWAEHKGFNDPLYHTGTMVEAVASRIHKGIK